MTNGRRKGKSFSLVLHTFESPLTTPRFMSPFSVFFAEKQPSVYSFTNVTYFTLCDKLSNLFYL